MTSPAAQMDIVIVHLHAAEQVRDAVAALRADARGTDVELHIIVADNGSTPDELRILQSLGIDYIATGANVGYAGAMNIAFARTRFPYLILMNEDVLVLPGCLRTLHDALASGAAIAGPEFYWDLDRVFRLPCTEEKSRRAELRKLAGKRTLPNLRRVRDAWREHARRHWRAVGPLPSLSLSGAMMAFRRDAWNTVGPIDSGFVLYFEEDDWYHRMAAAGLQCLYVPAAKVVHLHNPKLATTPARLKMEADSFVRFGNRYYGERFMHRLIAVSHRPPVVPEWPRWSGNDGLEIALDDLRDCTWPLWIELTVTPLGFPAATAVVTDPATKSWTMPPMKGLKSLQDATLYLQVVDDDGRELRGWSVTPRHAQV